MNFDVIKMLKGEPDMINGTYREAYQTNGKGGGKIDGGDCGVSIVTETKCKMFRISFQKRRRLNDKKSVQFVYIYIYTYT